MLYATLSRWLTRGPGSNRRSRGRCHRPARRPSFVPRLLVLEDRTLPSAFTVTSLLDTGAGSLRQAVLDANTQPGADTIRFADGLHGTIPLTNRQLSLADEPTIDGPGADQLAVSGNHQSRVFSITGGVTVTLAGLTITDGRVVGAPGQGGGILNVGSTLTLDHDVLSNNQALGAP